MTAPLISIIIPCYNGAKFIEKTLNSVAAQTYDNWEAIIVNDGSTDDSETVISNWIGDDKRFILHTQKNRGLSGSRNEGMKLASGAYIYFLDADDLIPQYTLADLFSYITPETDIVFGKTALTLGHNEIIEGYLDHEPPQEKVLTNENKKLIPLVIESPLICTAHNNLYRSSFLNGLTFKEGLLHEDELWFFETLFKARAIVLNNKPTYFYNVANIESITNNFSDKNLLAYLTSIDTVYNKYYLNPDNASHQEMIAIYLDHLKMKTLGHCYRKISKTDRNRVDAPIKDAFQITQNKRTTKVLNDNLELLHYQFRLVSVLDPIDIMNFLRYSRSKKFMRQLKKSVILRKAKRKNKQLQRTVTRL